MKEAIPWLHLEVTVMDGSVTDIPTIEKGKKTPSKAKKTITKSQKDRSTGKSNPKNAGATPRISKPKSHEPISDLEKQSHGNETGVKNVPPPTKETPLKIFSRTLGPRPEKDVEN